MRGAGDPMFGRAFFQLWFALYVFFFPLFGCAPQQQKVEVEVPQKLPITEQVSELAEQPEYLTPEGHEDIVPIAEGELAPMDGILFGEDAAEQVASLRIAYDELYWMSETNHNFLLTVLQIQEEELQRADKIIAKKDEKIEDVTASWWARNKFTVGTTVGIVVGIGLALATGKLWVELDHAKGGG